MVEVSCFHEIFSKYSFFRFPLQVTEFHCHSTLYHYTVLPEFSKQEDKAKKFFSEFGFFNFLAFFIGPWTIRNRLLKVHKSIWYRGNHELKLAQNAKNAQFNNFSLVTGVAFWPLQSAVEQSGTQIGYFLISWTIIQIMRQVSDWNSVELETIFIKCDIFGLIFDQNEIEIAFVMLKVIVTHFYDHFE